VDEHLSGRLLPELLAVVSDAVLVVDLDSMCVRAHNAKAAKLYDYPVGGLDGLRYDRALAVDPDSAADLLRQRRPYVPLRFHRRRDGKHISVEIRARFLEQEGHRLALLALRRRAEAGPELHGRNEAEERFRAIFEASAFPILLLDMEARVVDLNPCAESTYRRTRATMLGQTLASLTGAQELGRNLFLSRVTFVPANAHLRGDGSVFHAEILISYPRPIRRPWALALVRDVSEEQRALQMLRESERRWQFALEGHGDGVWDWDLSDGRVWVSDQLRRILGFAAGKALPALAALVHPRDLRRFQRSVGDHLSGRSELHEVEFRMCCEDGEYRWMICRGRLVEHDGEGRPRRMVGTLRDIHEAHGARERERIQLQELAHVGRLVTLGESATVLAHEINQPLTAIKNFGGVARRRLPDGCDPRLREALDMISAQALRAGEVVRRMRDFMSKSPSNWQCLTVNELITSMIRFVQFEADQRGVEFVLALDPEVPELHADRLQIEQVLLNLMRNAIEAINGGEAPGVVTVCSAYRHGRVEFEVHDNGGGLQGAARTALFEPFVTTKSDGSGLGLVICKSIVEAHGGEMWARDNEPQGMIFGFSLPIAP